MNYRSIIICCVFSIFWACTPGKEKIIAENKDWVMEKYSNIKKASDKITRSSFSRKDLSLPEPLNVWGPSYTSYGYEGHNAVMLPLVKNKKFDYPYRSLPSVGFYYQLKYLYKHIIDPNARYGFIKNDGHMWEAVKSLKTVKFCVIYVENKVVLPVFDYKAKKFTQKGSYDADFHVFRVKDQAYLGSKRIVGKSSETLKVEEKRFHEVSDNSQGSETSVYDKKSNKYVRRDSAAGSRVTGSSTRSIDLGTYEERAKREMEYNYSTNIKSAIKDGLPCKFSSSQ
ncbi:MAG: hypothetical protein GY754_31725 [bacterium]|nr:hypothetical protein [bacterium]